MAENQLRDVSGYTHELLMELTDEQLDEQEAYWREREMHHRSQTDDPGANTYRSHNYAAYRCLLSRGYVERERARRRG